MSLLQIRLKNCIQTILELKKDLNENHAGFFESDFLFLNTCLEKVDQMNLKEDEVCAMESYTSSFLEELGRNEQWDKIYNILQ